MIQSYIVTEDDNTPLKADREDFDYLVTMLSCAMCREGRDGFTFDVIEVIDVR